ncbi:MULTISPECIES: LysR family transcriptional regulator [Streptomyces]|uniref:LysR family transcriptional regulator n=2 Tax=Streptomyces rimosus subsp. rimosus TaxID=132474 RepID=L8EQX1_STRR1|nr:MULTISPECIES: LysR family transcriptional regulator [Streptomyces]KOG80093.1 LysR family transcriptional regulator [Kitasatospora aureofaciens]MYT41143.1 LysR family transcriptional regulator [Streptomyces sp. SID5471]KEF08368.1 LysR family transcriptional regulator [Streptomyces rimosus]KOT26345.1 LysR family transcriptional regulator [Streptomyces rimosus subsp. rimosus]KOT43845.1 LysR family transcriptional regulator [Streptomyces sp. NRRL WC-3701]
MELRQLRYFVSVVEEGGFTRAAARLHLAQPGLSAQIRQLEKEVGQPLLDRSGRSVTPTEVGRAVLPHARAALAAAEAVRQTVDAYTGLLRGRVTLGLVSGATGHVFDIAALLADFHDAHPSVELTLTEDTTERMQAALLAGELDIAILGTAEEVPPPGMAFQTVIDVPLVAAAAPNVPLPDRTYGTTIPLADLRDRPLICLPHGTGVRAALERGCSQAGFRPRVAFEAAAPHVLVRLAARGLGIAVLPAGEDESPLDGQLRTMRIVRPEMRARIALAWQATGPSSPAARALLDRLREALPKPPET